MNKEQRKYFCKCVDAICTKRENELKECEQNECNALPKVEARIAELVNKNPDKAAKTLLKEVMESIQTDFPCYNFTIRSVFYNSAPKRPRNQGEWSIGLEAAEQDICARQKIRDKYAAKFLKLKEQAEALKLRAMFCDLPEELIKLINKFEEAKLTDADIQSCTGLFKTLENKD